MPREDQKGDVCYVLDCKFLPYTFVLCEKLPDRNFWRQTRHATHSGEMYS